MFAASRDGIADFRQGGWRTFCAITLTALDQDRDHVSIRILPAITFHVSGRSGQSPPGTLRVGARLLRRMMDMYRSDAAGYNELVLAEELSERLFETRGESQHARE